jgi:hypothetical protein
MKSKKKRRLLFVLIFVYLWAWGWESKVRGQSAEAETRRKKNLEGMTNACSGVYHTEVRTGMLLPQGHELCRVVWQPGSQWC